MYTLNFFGYPESKILSLPIYVYKVYNFIGTNVS